MASIPSEHAPVTAADAAAATLAATHIDASSAAPSGADAAAAPASASASASADAGAEDAEDDNDDEEEDDDPNAPPVNPLSDSDSEDDAAAAGGSSVVRGSVGGTDVQLGFLVEPEHPRALLRTYFPCKVGGKAAWLNPRVLPQAKQLQCEHCANPLVFLMQVYAPLRSTHGASPATFHRTLFLFCCMDKSCENKQRSVLAFRSQLPLENPFYPSQPAPTLEPYDEEGPMPVLEDPAEPGVHLCCVCGNPAPSSCSRCHARRYCSRLHQLYDWKQGQHKTLCGQAAAASAATSASSSAASAASSSAAAAPSVPSLLFPQQEVVIEPEYLSDSEDDEDESDAKDQESAEARAARKAAKKAANKLKGDYSKEQAMLEAYQKTKAAEAAAGETEEDFAEEEEEVASTAANWASPKLKDPLFTRFKDRVAGNPEQILRYDRAPGADASSFQPLWVSTWFQPASPPMPPVQPQVAGAKPSPPPRPVAPTARENDAAIPPCTRCGGARRFEFQVLPQLLYYLGPNGGSLDFATLAVYTCAASCGDGVKEGYFEEFVWVQAHAQ